MNNSVFFKATFPNANNLIIKSGSIEESFQLSKEIPEFATPYPIEEYQKRLQGKHLILIAYMNDLPVGFKIGHEVTNLSFYSWLGGILPAFRKQKIASELILAQEQWVLANQYKEITIKTRNCFKGMLCLCIKHNYQIIQVESKGNINQNRILLSKQI